MSELEMKSKQFHEKLIEYFGDDNETIDELVQDICRFDKDDPLFLREFYNTIVARNLMLYDLVAADGSPNIGIINEISKKVITTISREKNYYDRSTNGDYLTEENDNRNKEDYKRIIEEMDFSNLSINDLIEIEKDLDNYIIYMNDEQIEELSCSLFYGQDENIIKMNSDKLKMLKKYKNGEDISEEEKNTFIESIPEAKNFEEAIKTYGSAHVKLSGLLENLMTYMEEISETDKSIDEIIDNIMKEMYVSENKSITEVLGCDIKILLNAMAMEIIAEKEENLTDKEKGFFIKSVPGAKDFEEAKKIYYVEKSKKPEIFNILKESENQNLINKAKSNDSGIYDNDELENYLDAYDNDESENDLEAYDNDEPENDLDTYDNDETQNDIDTFDDDVMEIHFDKEFEKAEDPYIESQVQPNIEKMEIEESQTMQVIEENSGREENVNEPDIVIRKNTFLEKMQESRNPFARAFANSISAIMNRGNKRLPSSQNQLYQKGTQPEATPIKRAFDSEDKGAHISTQNARMDITDKSLIPIQKGFRNSLIGIGAGLMNGINRVFRHSNAELAQRPVVINETKKTVKPVNSFDQYIVPKGQLLGQGKENSSNTIAKQNSINDQTREDDDTPTL